MTTQSRELWYKGKYHPKKWPKLTITKPYHDLFGRLVFMPRYMLTQRAFKLRIWLLRRELNHD